MTGSAGIYSILSLVFVGIFSASCSDGSIVNDVAQRRSQAGVVVSNNEKDLRQTPGGQSDAHVNTTQTPSKFTFKTSLVDGVETVDIASIRNARDAGYSSEAIVSEIMNSSAAMSEEALSFLAMSKFILKQYGASVVEGVTAMGLAAVDRARAAGLKDSEIKIYAKLQGIYFGEKALSSLGLSKYVLSTYGAAPVEGIMAMGLAAVDRARAAGVTDNEIKIYAKLQAVYFGEKALTSLGLGKYVLATYGAAPVDGVMAMGLAAVDRARAAGLTDNEIKTYAKLQGIYFGERALASLGV